MSPVSESRATMENVAQVGGERIVSAIAVRNTAIEAVHRTDPPIISLLRPRDGTVRENAQERPPGLRQSPQAGSELIGTRQIITARLASGNKWQTLPCRRDAAHGTRIERG